MAYPAVALFLLLPAASAAATDRIAFQQSKNIFDFSGRTGRGTFVLGYVVLHVCATIWFVSGLFLTVALEGDSLPLVVFAVGVSAVSFIMVCLATVWWCSLCWRRLQDMNKSGWYILWWLAPPIGLAVFVMMLVRKGDDGPNRYGPAPSAVPADRIGRVSEARMDAVATTDLERTAETPPDAFSGRRPSRRRSVRVAGLLLVIVITAVGAGW